MAKMVEVVCGNSKCKKLFHARQADVNRGWGKFCSKSCKAKKQGRLLASKETTRLWRDYNRETSSRTIWDEIDEHEAILDEMGETADDKWGDSGIY